MTRKYFSSRNKHKKISLEDLYEKLQNLYLYFLDRDYFKESGMKNKYVSDAIKYEAAVKLSFQPFPITNWDFYSITPEQIFDTIEYLFDKISKPEGWIYHQNDGGFAYQDYESYNKELGQKEFQEMANMFLNDFEDGYELSSNGEILSLGEDIVKEILLANILPYDRENVDSKIQHAVYKWRTRNLSLADRKDIIRELADVFEWLKKTKNLEKVLDKKDDSLIFELINRFEIRHHNPNQKGNYDKNIWYSWMFHFYLATYHAIIRLLIKNEEKV